MSFGLNALNNSQVEEILNFVDEIDPLADGY